MKFMKENVRKCRLGAYFTVETALVIPIAFAVVFLVMYLMFYRYNRCLMEQEVGSLLVKGAVMQTVDEKERVASVKRAEQDKSRDGYVLWEKKDYVIKVEKGKIGIEAQGGLPYPLAGWMLGDTPGEWGAWVKRTDEIPDPVFWTRLRRKMTCA